mmetsp:Transcript_287/g.285  ORF Transcript_287/g.285 Transcript_287/m.285 type:complete len:127 (-) Transcript_287:102-482(-)|eukprot:gene3905-4172_t
MSSNTNGTIQTRYPMIDPDPSLSKIVSNFGLKEYSIVAGTTVLAYSISWLKSSKPLRVPSARFAGFVGLAGGFSISWLFTLQRFQGLAPNQAELQRYGRLSPDEIDEGIRRARDGNLELVDPPKRQ